VRASFYRLWSVILLLSFSDSFLFHLVSISWSVSSSNRSTTDAAPLSFPKGAIYAFIFSSPHEAAIQHNVAFMKSRGGCHDLTYAPYPMFPLSQSEDLLVARFPFGDEQIGSRTTFNSVSIGRFRKRLEVTYRSQWSLGLFHCEERTSSRDSVVSHYRTYKVFLTGSAELQNPFGYASYDEYVPQIFVRPTFFDESRTTSPHQDFRFIPRLQEFRFLRWRPGLH
jgi:hypothetical protein